MHFRIATIVLLCSLLPLFVQAQKFGKVSKEELNMTAPEEDPEADAVILFNKAEMIITYNYTLEMSVHKRIKILTEAGKDYADVEIVYWHEDKIYNLKAISYSPDGKKHKLKDIHEERIKNFKKKVFAIPGVEVGSVIEFRYEHYSDYIRGLEPWDFQERDFTKLSELTVYIPAGMGYSGLRMNFPGKNIMEEPEVVYHPQNRSRKCQKIVWTAENIHGIKKEPYMTAFEDYKARILFQLTSIKNQYFSRDYAKTWDNQTRDLWTNRLKDHSRQSGDLRDLAESLTQHEPDPLKKAQILYDYVRTKINTDNSGGLWGDDFAEPEDVFRDGKGNMSEKNMLLINLLNHIDLDARPLFISKRSSGKINPRWVKLGQFNRLLAYLNIENQEWFLNTGNYCATFGCLTPEYNVERGLLVTEKSGKIIAIKPLEQKNVIDVTTRAELGGDGTLTGHTTLEYKGVRAIFARDDIMEDNLKDYLSGQLEKLHNAVELDSFQCLNMDSLDQPLVIDIHYHIPGYAEEAGNIMYMTMPLFTKQETNPFVRETRHFPVDYSHEYKKSEKIDLIFPENLTISEKPKRARKSIKNLIFSKVYFDDEHSIEVMRSFRLKQTKFKPHQYNGLREVYEKMVSSDQDQVVLVKN